MKELRFRPLTPDNFPTLLEWLQRPHVKEWWNDGDDTLQQVAAHYSRSAETTKRFILQLSSKDVGYIQYYKSNPLELGIDLFLADENLLSTGLGSRCLSAFIDMISRIEMPLRFVTDPHPENLRAIRCYEKCGFVQDSERSTTSMYFMAKEGLQNSPT